MSIKWLQFLHIVLLQILVVRLDDQLEVIGEVETDDIQVKVLLEHIIGLLKLAILLVHELLDLDHVVEKLLALLRPLLGHVLDLLLQLDGLLRDGFLFKLHLILHEFQFLFIIFLFFCQ